MSSSRSGRVKPTMSTANSPHTWPSVGGVAILAMDMRAAP